MQLMFYVLDFEIPHYAIGSKVIEHEYSEFTRVYRCPNCMHIDENEIAKRNIIFAKNDFDPEEVFYIREIKIHPNLEGYEELYNYNGNVNDFVEQYYQEPEEQELENKTIKPAIGQLELF